MLKKIRTNQFTMSYQIENMPVLEEYSREVSKNEHFVDTNILYINHILSDSLMVARAFKNSGADLWIVGVPYGNIKSPVRKETIRGFEKLGHTIIPNIDNPLNFSQNMRGAVKKAISQIYIDSRARKRKFMIVEDGGYAFPLLHDEPEHQPALDYCLGTIEHTMRGVWNYQFMETDNRPLSPRTIKKPAVTIANSLLKGTHEPPFVAQAVIDEAIFLLKKRHDFLKHKTVTVIGPSVARIVLMKMPE